MKIVNETEISITHENAQGARITSLKSCPHGVNVFQDGKWDLALCKDCSERRKRSFEV
jgi:hypothetical protein